MNNENTTINGILKMPEQNYHSLEAFNASGLKQFLKSPMHYRAWKAEQALGEDSTEALRFGRALHCLALEGHEEFNKRFAVAPVVDRRTKEGKAAWEAFINDNAGKDFVKAEEFITAQHMADRFRCNPLYAELAHAGIIVEGVIVAKLNGVLCKGKFDVFCPSKGIILDLKSIDKTPTYHTVRKAIFDYNYDIQDAFYRKLFMAIGIDIHGFQFSFVEKSEPYGIANVSMSVDILHQAYDRVDECLAQYKTCTETDVWPGLVSENTVITID